MVADHQGRRHQGGVGKRRLLLPVFLGFLIRHVVADDAAGRGAEEAVVVGIVPSRAAD
jgi:hypothetical protein